MALDPLGPIRMCSPLGSNALGRLQGCPVGVANSRRVGYCTKHDYSPRCTLEFNNQDFVSYKLVPKLYITAMASVAEHDAVCLVTCTRMIGSRFSHFRSYLACNL